MFKDILQVLGSSLIENLFNFCPLEMILENKSQFNTTKVKQFQDYTLYTTPDRSQTGWSLLPYPSEDHERNRYYHGKVSFCYSLDYVDLLKLVGIRLCNRINYTDCHHYMTWWFQQYK